MEDNVGALGDRLFIITGERDHYLKALEEIEKDLRLAIDSDKLNHSARNWFLSLHCIATDALKGGCDER